MGEIEKIQAEIEELPPEQKARLRRWFLEHDELAWDEAIERDVAAGRLDALAQEAIAEYQRGDGREL